MENKLNDILSLMSRMGEDLTFPSSAFEARINVMPLMIEEGLIKSYPVEDVMNTIANLFHLNINGEDPLMNWHKFRGISVSGNICQSTSNGEDTVIKLVLPKASENFDKINAKMLKYGWFNSASYEDKDNTVFVFERKFGDRFVARQLSSQFKTIYHVTSLKNKDKITKQGLIPKASKTPGIKNDERLYFSVSEPSPEDAKNVVAMHGKEEIPIVLKINVDKLNPNTSFFFDPRWSNSIYTFEPIPVQAIEF
jgi:hypothetical protein